MMAHWGQAQWLMFLVFIVCTSFANYAFIFGRDKKFILTAKCWMVGVPIFLINFVQFICLWYAGFWF